MDWSEQAGWSGAISAPRRAWLKNGRLATEPHPALDALRVGHPQPAANARIGAQAEIILPVAETGTIRLRFSDAEHLLVIIDAEADTITIDRTYASSDERADRNLAIATSAFDQEADRPAVRILLDGSIVEIFTSAGRSLTTRVYPTQAPPWFVEAPEDAIAWELKNAVAPEHVPAATARPNSVLA